TYRALEVFLVAGAIYLLINLVLTRLLAFVEHRMTPYLRTPQSLAEVKNMKGNPS
ncbi:ABC transporter permease, partial [Enterobacter cloacae subsp. cloacae]